MDESLRAKIEAAYADRSLLASKEYSDAVYAAVDALDRGELRVATPPEASQSWDEWTTHAWVKQAVLLFFSLQKMEKMEVGPFEFYDKVPLKKGLDVAGVRVVPPGVVRKGAFCERGVIVMPGYVNIGARVGAGTMVDTWATVGSCAQIGKNVHLSGGVGIGGVLEPPQAAPVIIGDESMIGSRSMITQGARVGVGCVVGEGTMLNPTIPVVDAETGEEISRGVIPDWSVAVQSWRMKEFAGGSFGAPIVLIVKRLTEGERHDKAKLNDILRGHGVNV